MNRTDFEELLAEERFTPFVITTHDGLSIAIGPEEQGRRRQEILNPALIEKVVTREEYRACRLLQRQTR
jgi:hypothetical protein